MRAIKTYDDLILETELLHMATTGLSKLSLFTILTIYCKIFEINLDLPINIRSISKDYAKDGAKFKTYLNENFLAMDDSSRYSSDKIDIVIKIDELLDKKIPLYFYAYFDGHSPKILMLSTVDYVPLKRDFMYDPKKFFVKPDIRKIDYDTFESYLYSFEMASQKMIDSYWRKEVAKDPSKIKKAEKEVSPEWKNDHKHFGTKFGFFD